MKRCLICTKKVRSGGFLDTLMFWLPESRIYGYNILMEDRLRLVWVLMCKEDFQWASKNPDAVQAIVNSKIGNTNG